MEGLPASVDLTKVADDTIVTANLVPLTRGLAHERIDSKWWELPGVSKEKKRAENDYHWKWAKRLGEIRNDRWHGAVAIQTDDGDVHGAMVYWVNGVSFVESEKGAIRVEALATAPRNRPWLVKSPLYRGVGERLLLWASAQSYLLGFEGRVNLVAFDEKRTISFYLSRGFEEVGYEDELPRFELSRRAALDWLQEQGFEL